MALRLRLLREFRDRDVERLQVAALEQIHQIEVACTMAKRSKSPDQNIARSSHIGVLLRSRPWKRGLSVWAGPERSIAAIRFT